MADVAWQGESNVINEGSLGNDRKRPFRQFTVKTLQLTMPQPAGSTTPETFSIWSTSSGQKCPGPSSVSGTVWAAHTC